MKLLILLLSLFIGVQSQTLEELNKKIEELEEKIKNITRETVEADESTTLNQNKANNLEQEIFDARRQFATLESRIIFVTDAHTSCQTTKSACLKEEEEKTRFAEKRLDEVKQDEERHRNELKALENEPKNDTDNLNDLNRELNEAQNNLKLLEAEMQQLRLKLNKCESKYHKVTNQTTVKKETDGGGFINKIVTSTLDKVQQFKKGVANVLRSKINFMKLKIPE